MLTRTRQAQAEAYRSDMLSRIAAATEAARLRRSGSQQADGQRQPRA